MLRPPYAQPIDRFLVRWTGWSPVTTQYALAGGADLRAFKTRVLLLTTIGRRSGALRSTVLPYFEVDDDLVICGTNGGGPHDPQWVKNIEAEGTCWVTVNRRQLPATAHVARWRGARACVRGDRAEARGPASLPGADVGARP